MKRNDKKVPIYLILTLVLIAVIAVVIGVFLGKKTALDSEPIGKKADDAITHDLGSPVMESSLDVPEEALERAQEIAGKIKKPMPVLEIDPCDQIEKQMGEYFAFLDQEQYIRDLKLESDTYSRFKHIVEKLAINPPMPAGNSLSSDFMFRNIFFFYRVLNRDELGFIKAVISNKADTIIEKDLEMFYRWLTIDSCDLGPEGIRPSFETAYYYSGFFLNTLGGRSYLFRRPTRMRLLVTYYSLLIIHEADIKGKNSYGIDIMPEINYLAKDISTSPNMELKEQYLQNLKKIQDYYTSRR